MTRATIKPLVKKQIYVEESEWQILTKYAKIHKIKMPDFIRQILQEEAWRQVTNDTNKVSEL